MACTTCESSARWRAAITQRRTRSELTSSRRVECATSETKSLLKQFRSDDDAGEAPSNTRFWRFTGICNFRRDLRDEVGGVTIVSYPRH